MIINYTSKRTHRPDVLGSNLVTNPGPFNNTTGWTAANSATLSATSGALRIARNGVNNPGASQSVAVEYGELYLIEATYQIGTASDVYIVVTDGVAYRTAYGDASSGSFSQAIVPLATSISIITYAIASTGTQYAEISLMSVKKITTLGHGDTQLVGQPFLSDVIYDLGPWTGSNATLSISGVKLRITNSGAVNGLGYLFIPTVIGHIYDMSVLYTEGTCTAAAFYASDYFGGTILGSVSLTTTATTYTATFTATSTTTEIWLQNSNELNAYNDFSAITVTQADSGYTLEKDIASESDGRPSVGGWRQISIGGNSESNYGRKDEIHTVTTTAILSRSEADDWKEFFDSCAGGETFTIDLYQDPRPELITNGTFDTATTGWTAGNSTLSVDSRRLKITNSGAVNGQGKCDSFTTIAGVEYRLTFDSAIGTCANFGAYLGTTSGGTDIYSEVITTSTTHSVDFMATTATTYLQFTNDATNNGYNFFDNVSVKSIATDEVVSAILEGDGKIDRITSHLYQATFSYRVI